DAAGGGLRAPTPFPGAQRNGGHDTASGRLPAGGRDHFGPENPKIRVGRWPTATGSIVPVDSLAALVTLLRLDREGCDGTGFEALERNGLAGFLAIAVGAVVYALQGGVDLGDQLA